MEDVIVGLLFVYFFVIRPILKQARKAEAKKPGAKPRASLRSLLENLREKVREAAEQGGAPSQEQGKPISSWKDLFQAVAERPAAPAAELAPDARDLPGWGNVPVVGGPGAAVGASRKRPAPVEVARKSAAEKRKDAAALSAAEQGQPAVAASVADGISLRQAVIWSEILGPPVALRDPEWPG